MNIKDITYEEIKKLEKPFEENERHGSFDREVFEFYKGDTNLMLTAVHTVKTKTMKDGEVIEKKSEPFTGALVLLLREITGCHVMVRTHYPDEYIKPQDSYGNLINYVNENKIKFLNDQHGAATSNPFDVAIGIGNGWKEQWMRTLPMD